MLNEDSEFSKIRLEFIESLSARHRDWLAQQTLLRQSETRPQALLKCIEIAHKLAGAAGPYGLPFLSELAGCMEDLLLSKVEEEEGFVSWMSLLGDALFEAGHTESDPESLRSDARWLEVTSFFEALRGEAKS